MANVPIDMPGSGNAHLNINDTLTINFKQTVVFCATNTGITNPALPSGSEFQSGSSWVGTATTVGSSDIDHKEPGHACGSGAKITDTGSRIIQVGSGLGKK